MGAYDKDFYGWAMEQAALLRAGRLADLDVAHVAEEIEDLGKREKRELTSRLAVLLTHLLKWQLQAQRRGRSWRLTLAEQRDSLLDLDLFPRANPWTLEQILDSEFYPE